MKANLLMVAVAYNKNLLYVEIIKPRDCGACDYRKREGLIRLIKSIAQIQISN